MKKFMVEYDGMGEAEAMEVVGKIFAKKIDAEMIGERIWDMRQVPGYDIKMIVDKDYLTTYRICKPGQAESEA